MPALCVKWVRTSGWFGRMLLSIDTANPNYKGKLHLIRSWMIEFDETGSPWREIGLDADGAIVVAGPSDKDYGFWLDTTMQYADFVGETVTQEKFEALWDTSGVTCPGSRPNSSFSSNPIRGPV